MATATTDTIRNHTAAPAGVVFGLASRGPVLLAGIVPVPKRH